MLKSVIKKNKDIIKYLSVIIILLFLLVILLYEDAYKTLYIVCLSSAFSAVLIGQNNSVSKLKLGFGITRKEIELQLIKDLIVLLVNTIILICFNMLFIYIVLNTIKLQLRIIIFSFLVSLFLSFLALFIKNNINNKKFILIIIIISIIVLVISYLIPNKIITNIILVITIVFLYFVNRYNIYHNEIL